MFQHLYLTASFYEEHLPKYLSLEKRSDTSQGLISSCFSPYEIPHTSSSFHHHIFENHRCATFPHQDPQFTNEEHYRVVHHPGSSMLQTSTQSVGSHVADTHGTTSTRSARTRGRFVFRGFRLGGHASGSPIFFLLHEKGSSSLPPHASVCLISVFVQLLSRRARRKTEPQLCRP